MPFRFLDHTGDTAIGLTAESDEELFRDAARALSSIIIDTERAPPETRQKIDLELEAEDDESLLIDFLNELIFLFDSKRFLPGDLDVERLEVGAPARIRATVWGETFDPDRHVFLTEVKAATFHNVEISRTPGKISTTVVFDL